MRVRFHPQAQRELAEAARWYEQRRAGLGSELRRTVRDALRLVATNPAAWPRWPDLPEVRVYSLSRFPFVLPYFPDEAHIVVLAVAHASCHPGYWQARLRDL
jgi:plasmid stabilization system protein ParE